MLVVYINFFVAYSYLNQHLLGRHLGVNQNRVCRRINSSRCVSISLTECIQVDYASVGKEQKLLIMLRVKGLETSNIR